MPDITVILDPTAPAEQVMRAPGKLDHIRGKVVGIIDNSKPNFHYLADDIAELLVARHGAASVVRHRKRLASIPAPDPVMKDVTEKCDLVIAGSGD